ncbi:hypothetical protein CMO91_03930 [Candidatus Woesearchaeota archaeon]|nr:hypothetical protein [Candidatus Woesearchaeota archaeon]|tara:strand:- start:165 stop:509 length:345 start_codon:yes stop_codon:yes gene_type:complete
MFRKSQDCKRKGPWTFFSHEHLSDQAKLAGVPENGIQALFAHHAVVEVNGNKREFVYDPIKRHLTKTGRLTHKALKGRLFEVYHLRGAQYEAALHSVTPYEERLALARELNALQ